MSQEHPFAQYIRILGKGRKGSRGLTSEEAYEVFRMIMADEVEPIQLGALLMLMRYKEETPEEVAAAVHAIRDSMGLQSLDTPVDLDWSSYAGKKRQLPWYLLATLLMAENGIRIFMHGASGHTEGRLYTKDVLPTLGIKPANSLQEAASQIESGGFAYIDLEQLNSKLHEIIELRPLLGLRSPVHTISRMLNPFNAPYMMQGIFHPGYHPTHQLAGQLLEQPHLAVIKGEGGEIERNPDLPMTVQSVHLGELSEEEWPAMFSKRHVKPDELSIDHLIALWNGSREDEYAEAAVVGTVAVTLYMMGRASTREAAEAEARSMWKARNRTRFNQAA